MDQTEFTVMTGDWGITANGNIPIGKNTWAEAPPVIDATKAEHTRILAALNKHKPVEQPYTRVEWRHEERGAQKLWDTLMAEIGGDEYCGQVENPTGAKV